MEGLNLYDKVRKVPKEAQKAITGGRLNGKTDINPMWRIKTLTEHFGPCGIGWYYEITKQWLEEGNNGEIAGFCNINLYVKDKDEWSKPIQGTGGSSFIAKEKNGLYTSDEVYKMALTDAISVACKALGFGADIYWSSDRTKYDRQSEESEPVKTTSKVSPAVQSTISEAEIKGMEIDILNSTTREEVVAKWKKYQSMDALSNGRLKKAVHEVCEKLGIQK